MQRRILSAYLKVFTFCSAEMLSKVEESTSSTREIFKNNLLLASL